MKTKILDFFKDWFFNLIIGFVILFLVLGVARLFGYSGFWENGLSNKSNTFIFAVSLVIFWTVQLWLKAKKTK